MVRIKRMGSFALVGALVLALLTTPTAPALSFKQIPATAWGHIYAGAEPVTPQAQPAKTGIAPPNSSGAGVNENGNFDGSATSPFAVGA
jgi:hypothetical protein